MKFIIFNAISIILINVLLFLAINTHQLFAYVLISFLFLLLSSAFKKILNSQNSNNVNNDFSKSKNKQETAEAHPIIRSARKRLGK